MAIPSNVTRHNLNSVMEFDHVIQVHADGTVTDADSGLWAPEVWVDEDPRNPTVSCQPGRVWRLMNGYSGQWMYRGPIMHASEFIGGKLADDILDEPGFYVAVVVTDPDSDDDAGWAVARLDEEPPNYELIKTDSTPEV